jgi:hypothetical protein
MTHLEEKQLELITALKQLSNVIRPKYIKKFKVELTGTQKMIADLNPRKSTTYIPDYELAESMINKAIEAVNAERRFNKMLIRDICLTSEEYEEILMDSELF